MGKGGGRRRDDKVRKHFKSSEKGKVKCEYCGEEFAASISVTRMRDHINKRKGRGIEPCSHSPQPNNFGFHKPNFSNNLEHNLLRHQGQIQAEDAQDQEMTQVSSSFVSNGENKDLKMMKRYVFESLKPEDKVFISPSSRLYLTQKELITLLKPEAHLDSWVIDIFVEILTEYEKKKATPSSWYLPVTFSTAALGYDERKIPDFLLMQNFKENYIFDQESPEKVFVPVHVRPNEYGHFYLCILHLNKNEIEIWDSRPRSVDKTKRAEITKKLLFAMEILFKKKRTFSNYQMEMAKDILSQPNGFDCGVFVINYMQQSDNFVKVDDSFQFDSQKEREDLALELLTNDLNQEKQNLYQKARRHYEQVVKQDGTKRLLVDGVNKHDDLEKGSSSAYLLPTSDLIGKNFQRYSEQIRGWIKDEVSSIGIWGMGGSGKTALATHIYDKLLEEVDTKVIWVTVSQNSISHLQKVVARSIKLNISDEFEVKVIARKLFQAFKEMKKHVVIILDDVWDHFILKEVGFPMSDGRITMIMTTRIRDVCQVMGCKENIIEMKSLDGEDSLALFEKFMELHDEMSPEVKGIAQNLSYECRGLPLAIVRIATSMKGKTQASEWSYMLDCSDHLGNGQYEMDKWVLPVLKSSYDFLNNKLQRFFLYCALNTCGSFDYDDADRLIRIFAFESIDETKKMTVRYNEGYNMLNKLKSHSMLERYSNSWIIHVFLRFLAIGIAEDTGKTMANAYKNLTEIPRDDQWKEDLQKVFLTGNEIETIPNGTRPRCSQLSTLLLDCNENLNYIPDDFFNNMPVLKTLDLSHTNIKSLPESVSSLKCLIALLLSGCEELSYIPSLRELKQLIALDLSYTAITEAPTGLESLVNLRYLNLLGIYIEIMPASHISKLINLEWLELDWITGPGDIQGLEKLEVLVAYFYDIGVFNTFMSFLEENYKLRSKLRIFDLTLVGGGYNSYINKSLRERSVKRITFKGVDLGNGEAILLGDIKELFIRNCSQLIGVRDPCKFLSYDQNNNNPLQIEWLDIEECDNVHYLCCLSGSCPFCSSSQLVGRLSLFNLKDMKDLVSPYAHVSSHESSLFSHLTDLHIVGCNSMETVMTPKLLALLQNLRTIEVGLCEMMKEIVVDYDHWNMEVADHDYLMTLLPKLTSLELKSMPQLKSVCKHIMFFPCLQTFSAVACPQLDRPCIANLKGWGVLPIENISEGYSWQSIKID